MLDMMFDLPQRVKFQKHFTVDESVVEGKGTIYDENDTDTKETA
jgi:hypothetical protein